MTGYPNAVEVALLEEFAVYKENGETEVFVRDRRLRTNVRQVALMAQTRLNFRVIRRDSEVYDMVVCTRKVQLRDDWCMVYEINTNRSIFDGSIQIN